MKKTKIFSAMAGLMLAALTSSCEGEKDLVIINGNLPIKTDALYMLGDATPNGWDNGNPTPFAPTEEDPMIYEWEGGLYAGEIKLCLVPGSWDVPFIRPMEGGREINSTNIVDETFDMHAGDPDNKWRVTEAGKYRLSFNLRNWTYSTTFLGGAEAPVVEPIETDVMYLVGSATPANWDINDPVALTKTAPYTFVYEGKLKEGEMKGYIETGNFDTTAIRPGSADVKINKSGVESEDFVFAVAPDNKWKVEEAGIYRLTFDLQNWKIKAEFISDVPDEDPLLAATVVYIVGDATPAGWNIGDPTKLDRVADHVFVFEGDLYPGEMKAYLEKGEWDIARIRPEVDQVKINKNGVESDKFIFAAGEDTKWKVEERGTYKITFDLEKQTIKAEYKGNDEPINPVDPLADANEIYLIGSATAGGWDWGQSPAMTKTGELGVFEWTGELNEGELKAAPVKDYADSNPFLRPASDGTEINESGVANPTFIFSSNNDGPDNKWNVTAAGNYTIRFNVMDYTITATFNK